MTPNVVTALVKGDVVTLNVVTGPLVNGDVVIPNVVTGEVDT